MASEHGTYSRYVNQRCRCDRCRAAKRDYTRGQRARGRVQHPAECAHCGGPLPPALPQGGKPRRFCSKRCARAIEQYDLCGCGARKKKVSTRCAACYGRELSRTLRAKNAGLYRQVERMWATGATMTQIAAAIGWAPRSVQSSFVVWREMGLDLPYRRSPESLERIRAGARRRWEGRAAA